ncbi:alkylmercury lyase family protein [Streptomyces sp. BRA346]
MTAVTWSWTRGTRTGWSWPTPSLPYRSASPSWGRALWWGGCAWDSFALPHLLRDEPDVLVATRCPACDTPHAWVVGRGAPPPGGQVAYFLGRASRRAITSPRPPPPRPAPRSPRRSGAAVPAG